MTRPSVPPVERAWIGSFPYAGTSGNVAGTASEDARRADDTSGTTARRQLQTRIVLAAWGEHGGTWAEVAKATGQHHGGASGALSALHKEGRVARLTERRGRCSVYVLPEYVAGRETEPHGRRSTRTCPHCGEPL